MESGSDWGPLLRALEPNFVLVALALQEQISPTSHLYGSPACQFGPAAAKSHENGSESNAE
jgi:hypothetical protein